MTGQPCHRPRRQFAEARRLIVPCDLELCLHCGEPLRARRPWHMRKTVQTLTGPVFVAGKSKECTNPACAHFGQHYYASRALMISLPHSTYGLDVLAFIGWQHEHEHRQLVEIQRALNRRGVLVNERNVGKLYRQFLALLGGLNEYKRQRLATAVAEYGGLVWAVDALQPEGHGTLLYVMYESLSETPVAAIQLDHPTAEELVAWLRPYQTMSFPVLATLSDGEEAIIAALRTCWPAARPQRCQAHFLSNLAEPVLEVDTSLREQLRQDLGGLPAVPEWAEAPTVSDAHDEPPAEAPPFYLSPETAS